MKTSKGRRAGAFLVALSFGAWFFCLHFFLLLVVSKSVVVCVEAAGSPAYGTAGETSEVSGRPIFIAKKLVTLLSLKTRRRPKRVPSSATPVAKSPKFEPPEVPADEEMVLHSQLMALQASAKKLEKKLEKQQKTNEDLQKQLRQTDYQVDTLQIPYV